MKSKITRSVLFILIILFNLSLKLRLEPYIPKSHYEKNKKYKPEEQSLIRYQNIPNENKIFLSRVASIKGDMLKEFLEKTYGTVLKLDVVPRRNVAFASFEKAESAQHAIDDNQVTIQGELVRIKMFFTCSFQKRFISFHFDQKRMKTIAMEKTMKSME